MQRKCQETAFQRWTNEPVRNVGVARVEGLCDLVVEMKREDTVHMQPAVLVLLLRLYFACRGSYTYLMALQVDKYLLTILLANRSHGQEAIRWSRSLAPREICTVSTIFRALRWAYDSLHHSI